MLNLFNLLIGVAEHLMELSTNQIEIIINIEQRLDLTIQFNQYKNKLMKPEFSAEQISPETMTEEDIQDWLAEQIADQIGIEPEEIDIQASFDTYGLDSVQVMSIANLGKQYFGLQLSPVIMWNYPNIQSLSEYLITEIGASEREILEI